MKLAVRDKIGPDDTDDDDDLEDGDDEEIDGHRDQRKPEHQD